ncbi:MAG: hypothetical protein PHX83_01265 [Acidobacteriia bacterium]|nr:hypothetical protein [Terriglobia bacterium]
MRRKKKTVSAASLETARRLSELHESIRDILRRLEGLSEKKLWGGLGYRYEGLLFFTLTLRARTVLIEMKLLGEEADRARELPFVHPHSFKRLARNGWVAVSATPEVPLRRIEELVDRSYWSRIESRPRSKAMPWI